jgi:superfamily II DNA or RNA helicase
MQALHAGRGVLQMPTGGGKTLLAAHLIQAIDRPAFFFVHTRDLLHQTIAVFERELGLEVGVLGDGRAELRPLTVATIQTAYRAVEDLPPPRLPRRKTTDEDDEPPPEPPLELDEATRHEVMQALAAAPLVIFDECHHLPADSFYGIAMQAGAARWRFGLSATPWRDDRQDMLLEAALGPAVSVTNFSDLIRLGHLVPPRIRLASPRPPRIAGGARRVAYAQIYSAAIVENQERNRAIATQARDWAAEGLSVLILVAQTAHGRKLQKLLPEAQFMHGALDSRFRRQALAELERKLHPILIATTLADEGLDVPTLNAVILAGGGKSASRIYQRIGRALRPAEGKSEARILDFVDDMPYLRDHSEARIELYRHEACFRIEQDSASTISPESPRQARRV